MPLLRTDTTRQLGERFSRYHISVSCYALECGKWSPLFSTNIPFFKRARVRRFLAKRGWSCENSADYCPEHRYDAWYGTSGEND